MIKSQRRNKKYKSYKGKRQVRNLISEEIQNIKQQDVIVNVLINEGKTLKKAGLERQQINENLLDMLGGFMKNIPGMGGGAIVDRIKEGIAAWILQKIGLDPAGGGMTGALGCSLKNGLGEMEWEDITGMISGDKQVCDTLVMLTMKGMRECFTEEKMLNPLIDNMLGDGASTSALGKVFSEMLSNMIGDSELVQQVEGNLQQAICTMDFSEVMSGIPGGERLQGMVGMGRDFLGGLGGMFGGSEQPAQ